MIMFPAALVNSMPVGEAMVIASGVAVPDAIVNSIPVNSALLLIEAITFPNDKLIC